MLSLEYLAGVVGEHAGGIASKVREFSIGDRFFAFNSAPEIMGVINLSPDSWYRESVCLTVEAAVSRAKILLAQGAAIIDVGAESTLAHAARADAECQIEKLVPVVRGIVETGGIASVETYHKDVARAALDAGARVINLTGLEDAAEIYRMAAEFSAAVIVCHVQGANVREVGDCNLDGIFPAMREYFSRQIDLAAKNGMENLVIDPGLGFYYRNLQDSATRVRHQMTTFLNTFRLRELGVPVCHALPHAFENFGEDVRCAEPFFAVLAALGKTDLFRTHEVSRVRAVLATMRQF